MLLRYSLTQKRFSSTAHHVILEKIKNVGLITINRPKQLNAMNWTMGSLINKQLKIWENDSNISSIIIKNDKSSNAFCAGGDIKVVRDCIASGDYAYTLECIKGLYTFYYNISKLKKPYVALINGITMGGGIGLSIHGKYRVATEKTVVAMPETAIGFFPDVGAAFELTRLEGKLGLYLALTGARLRGKEVYDTGIATHFINSSNVDELLNELQSNEKADNVGIVLNKFNSGPRSKYPLDKINETFEADSVENIIKNLVKDNSDWSVKQLKVLSKMSPTSLMVTFEQFRLTSAQTLKEVFELDYQLAHRFIWEKDFPEGVRAQVVDKDNRPDWNPKTINGISREKLAYFFTHLNSDDKLNLES